MCLAPLSHALGDSKGLQGTYHSGPTAADLPQGTARDSRGQWGTVAGWRDVATFRALSCCSGIRGPKGTCHKRWGGAGGARGGALIHGGGRGGSWGGLAPPSGLRGRPERDGAKEGSVKYVPKKAGAVWVRAPSFRKCRRLCGLRPECGGPCKFARLLLRSKVQTCPAKPSQAQPSPARVPVPLGTYSREQQGAAGGSHPNPPSPTQLRLAPLSHATPRQAKPSPACPCPA